MLFGGCSRNCDSIEEHLQYLREPATYGDNYSLFSFINLTNIEVIIVYEDHRQPLLIKPHARMKNKTTHRHMRSVAYLFYFDEAKHYQYLNSIGNPEEVRLFMKDLETRQPHSDDNGTDKGMPRAPRRKWELY